MILQFLTSLFIDSIHFLHLFHVAFTLLAESDLKMSGVLSLPRNFQEWMEMVHTGLAFGTKVVVLADNTLVNVSFDGELEASVALHVLIQHFIPLLPNWSFNHLRV